MAFPFCGVSCIHRFLFNTMGGYGFSRVLSFYVLCVRTKLLIIPESVKEE